MLKFVKMKLKTYYNYYYTFFSDYSSQYETLCNNSNKRQPFISISCRMNKGLTSFTLDLSFAVKRKP